MKLFQKMLSIVFLCSFSIVSISQTQNIESYGLYSSPTQIKNLDSENYELRRQGEEFDRKIKLQEELNRYKGKTAQDLANEAIYYQEQAAKILEERNRKLNSSNSQNDSGFNMDKAIKDLEEFANPKEPSLAAQAQAQSKSIPNFTNEQYNRFIKSPCFQTFGITSESYEEQDQKYSRCESQKSSETAKRTLEFIIPIIIIVFAVIIIISDRNKKP